MSYADFIAQKRKRHTPSGFTCDTDWPALFPHQKPIVRWALRMGKAAIFLDTGLGKTLTQLTWAAEVAAHTGGKVILFAPLAVGEQTLTEAARFGIDAGRVGSESPIHVINYDRIHQVDPADYAGVVLDESSILKSIDGKTRNTLIEAFHRTPYRLACTATPAPNDQTELGNHAEFLGICTRTEMLAEFFVHDGGATQDWRLKGHARRLFWEWVASWAVLVKKPSDLGFDDGAYNLPALHVIDHEVKIDAEIPDGMLFAPPAAGLNDQRKARRDHLMPRVQAVADLVASEPDEQWLIWCDLNDESDALADAIPGAVEVRGSDDNDTKRDRLLGFAAGNGPHPDHQDEDRRLRPQLADLRPDGVRRPDQQLRELVPSRPPLLAVRSGSRGQGLHGQDQPRCNRERQPQREGGSGEADGRRDGRVRAPGSA